MGIAQTLRDRKEYRCKICGEIFKPHPRLKERQQTCGKDVCRKKHRAKYQREWRRKNPEAEEGYQSKVKNNRPSNFWKTYRKTHLQSTDRNRQQTKLRKRLKKAGLQRKLDIVQLAVKPSVLRPFKRFAIEHRWPLTHAYVNTAACYIQKQNKHDKQISMQKSYD